MTSQLDQALSDIPDALRVSLIDEYHQSQHAAARADWEKVGLKAGKICEIVYCIILGYCNGSYPYSISKPKDMQSACRSIETSTASSISRSARIQIPRLIAAIYELRNNRAIGHAGGDVQPNQMDGLLFNQSIKWLMAELVRLYATVSLSQASDIVEKLSLRWTAAVWQDGMRQRVLIADLNKKDKMLTFLYFNNFSANLDEMRTWLEETNITNLKNRTIRPLHNDNFIDFDPKKAKIRLLPPGASKVESEILTQLSPS